MKKLFIISSVILSVLLIFWGIYNFAFKEDVAQKTEKSDDAERRALADLAAPEAVAVDGKIKDISNEGVIAPIVRLDGNKIVFYSVLDGKVFSIDFDGTGKNSVSYNVLEKLTNVIWSADQRKVISEFDGGKKKSVYNYDTKTAKVFGAGMYNFAWSNLGDKILYQYKNGKTNQLSVADWSGENWKKIIDTTFWRITIAPIPQSSLVTFWNYPASNEETALSAVGIMGGETKKIFGGKFGADYLWSPSGKKSLVSFAENQNGSRMSLGVINQDGTNFRDLKIPTLASKCVWGVDEKMVYYAIPSNIPEGAVMPDDYQSGKFRSKDTFWKLNVETGEKTRLIELDELSKLGASFDATKLFLSPNEDILFFVDQSNKHLYRLDLEKK